MVEKAENGKQTTKALRTKLAQSVRHFFEQGVLQKRRKQQTWPDVGANSRSWGLTAPFQLWTHMQLLLASAANSSKPKTDASLNENDSPLFFYSIRHPSFNPNEAVRCTGETFLMKLVERVQSLDGPFGCILKELCRQKPDMQTLEDSAGDSVLMKFLRNCSDDPHFKTSQETLDVIRFLLNNGADPNCPPHTLAYATIV